ncbi:MAG: 5-oxoprolinase subunit B/C family protein [Thermoanaerobaculia bacterium]
MQVGPAGDRALLIDFGAIDAAELHARALRVKSRADVLACIVGHQSLYLVFRGAADPGIDLSPADAAVVKAHQHRIEVSFAPEHAPDLDDLLQRLAISRSSFVDRVSSLVLRARYLGFRAGFAYLDGWPEEWAMPRRRTSRPVPRGSFALAAAMTGFYPIDTPGGWNLLGRTDARLWDPQRDPPNLIAAGDSVEIVPVDRALHPPIIPPEPPPGIDGIEIVSGGQFTTVVSAPDWKRVDSGRSPGGPFDLIAAAAANRAVGNEETAPLLECALVGPRVRFQRDATIAWRGDVRQVRAGEEIAIGRVQGMREYLAVKCSDGLQPVDGLKGRRAEAHRHTDHREVRVVAGPHITPLRSITCEVTQQLDRIGIRLRPLETIAFDVPGDLPSCGMQFGTIQLHPDRSLVAMGPDHPITGGYLQPLTVVWDDRWKLGQLAPGDRVRFVCD